MLSKLLMENTAITEEINDTILNTSPEESPIIVQHQEMMEATLTPWEWLAENVYYKVYCDNKSKFLKSFYSYSN